MDGLSFDPVEHKYFYAGHPVPGVTDILKTVGLSKDWTGIDPFYRDRGIATHKAIELWMNGDLDETSLDPVIVPYFQGFKAWWKGKKESDVYGIEMPLYSQRLKFAGTLDLIYGDTIYDYKCSKAPDPVSELQGAAYTQLWGEYHGVEFPFKVLCLPGDGSFREIDYKTEDPNLWDAVMSLYQWKMKGKRK